MMLNIHACATSTEWLRAISQAFHSHTSMHIWQFVALSQPVVIPLPMLHAHVVIVPLTHACASIFYRRNQCVAGCVSRKHRNALRLRIDILNSASGEKCDIIRQRSMLSFAQHTWTSTHGVFVEGHDWECCGWLDERCIFKFFCGMPTNVSVSE